MAKKEKEPKYWVKQLMMQLLRLKQSSVMKSIMKLGDKPHVDVDAFQLAQLVLMPRSVLAASPRKNY
jgi:hypothetical protein